MCECPNAGLPVAPACAYRVDGRDHGTTRLHCAWSCWFARVARGSADRQVVCHIDRSCTGSAAVSGMAHSTLKESDVLTRSAKNSRAVTVTGVIDSHPRLQGDSHVANAFIDTVTTEDVTVTSSQSVRMTWSDTELTRGSAFTGTGTLQPLPDDFAAVAMLDLTDVVALSEQSGVDTIRRALRDAVEERPWHAQLIPGVVVGDDTGLPEHAVEDMRILGLSHLTAVSGAHISLTIGLVLGIVGRKRPILAGVLSIVALAGLVELVGSEASVLRAGYMGIFVCFALAIRRATTAFPIRVQPSSSWLSRCGVCTKPRLPASPWRPEQLSRGHILFKRLPTTFGRSRTLCQFPHRSGCHRTVTFEYSGKLHMECRRKRWLRQSWHL